MWPLHAEDNSLQSRTRDSWITIQAFLHLKSYLAEGLSLPKFSCDEESS